MTDCNDALHELYEFLDGELTLERRAHIQQHLTDRSPCLETFDFQAELHLVRRMRAEIAAAQAGEIREAAE